MKRKNRAIALIILLPLFAGCFFGCTKKPSGDDESTTAAPTAQQSDVFFETEEVSETLPPTTEIKKEPSTEKTAPSQSAAPTEKETAKEESTSSKYTRTGESVFSDDPDNKYISAVASKYNLDKSLLAAVYTIPDADGNMVMEFDGTKDENGKLIRDENTLKAIYTVDKNLNSKRASKDAKLNEYSSIESKTMFFTVTKYIIPKFENEL